MINYEEILSNFTETLNELMGSQSLNASDLSKATHIARTAIIRYLHRMGLPALKTAVKLANFFQCSLDYLLGLTDNPQFDNSSCEINFISCLEKMMSENQVGVRQLATECNFQSSNIAKWKNGSMPSLDKLVSIALYFDCSLETLIGRESS